MQTEDLPDTYNVSGRWGIGPGGAAGLGRVQLHAAAQMLKRSRAASEDLRCTISCFQRVFRFCCCG